MNKRLDVTVDLTTDDVFQAIAEYVYRNMGVEVPTSQVEINMATRTEGIGLAEHDVVSFVGATAKVKGDKQ